MEILLIEGEQRTAAFLARGFSAEGFGVVGAAEGRSGLERVLDHRFDLVLVGLVLGTLDEYDVLRALRAELPELPVIVLSARADLTTKLRAFDLGAADVVQKPFAFEELVARVHAQLRKKPRHVASIVAAAGLVIDLVRHEARIGDHVVELTGREVHLLTHLLEHRGEVVSRERLLSEVWGYYFDPRSNVVDVCVGRLRKKLGPEAPIETVRLAGYRLSAA
jgi:two-component system, OmpR family, copper resistance phosphate regulon response regulator CusR